MLNNDKIRALDTAPPSSRRVGPRGRHGQGRTSSTSASTRPPEDPEWRQTWDLVEWRTCAKRDAVNDAQIFGRNRQLYYDIMGAWGAGEFDANHSTGESNREKLAAKLFADDFTLDPRYPSTYRRDACDVLYDGPDGYLRWCDFFAETFATPDFTVREVYP